MIRREKEGVERVIEFMDGELRGLKSEIDQQDVQDTCVPFFNCFWCGFHTFFLVEQNSDCFDIDNVCT